MDKKTPGLRRASQRRANSMLVSRRRARDREGWPIGQPSFATRPEDPLYNLALSSAGPPGRGHKTRYGRVGYLVVAQPPLPVRPAQAFSTRESIKGS